MGMLDGISPNLPDTITREAFTMLSRDGVTWDGARTPFVFKTVNAVVITAAATLWTPAAGKRFRLMGFLLAQGVVTGAVTLADGGATIFIIPPNTIGLVIPPPALGNGILSAAANNALTAIGAATETLTGTIWGTEE